MKRLLLSALLLVLAMNAIHAQRADNYLPKDTTVEITSTNLPIVWIEVGGTMIQRNDYITARMKIIYNGDGQLNYADTVAYPGQHIDYDGYIALKYRGNSSFTQSAKKPYGFRPLDKPLEDGGEKQKVKLLGMPKDNKWAFLAPYSDRSMMRDLLAFYVSKPWMEYTPQGRFCEIILDGTYYGVYVLTEVVSKGKNRLNLPDPGNEGDELTGGYLLQVDRGNERHLHKSKYHPVDSLGNEFTDKTIYFQYDWPDYKDMNSTQVNYINNRIDEVEDVLASDYYCDPDSGYTKYIDRMNFVDYQLAEELGHNVDGYRMSGKFFKRTDSEDPRFKMVVWDMNLAYGNSNYYNGSKTNSWIYKSNDLMYSKGEAYLVPFWWHKLNNDTTYAELVKTRWAEYRRNNVREDRIMAAVDSMVNVLTIEGAEARNSQAWPTWGTRVWPNPHWVKNYAEEISILKDWLTQRIAWMDEQLGYDPNAVLRGDVNGDGEVDVSDLSDIIDHLLKGRVIDEAAADSNLDGEVDVSDVSSLADFLLIGRWP